MSYSISKCVICGKALNKPKGKRPLRLHIWAVGISNSEGWIEHYCVPWAQVQQEKRCLEPWAKHESAISFYCSENNHDAGSMEFKNYAEQPFPPAGNRHWLKYCILFLASWAQRNDKKKKKKKSWRGFRESWFINMENTTHKKGADLDTAWSAASQRWHAEGVCIHSCDQEVELP